MAFVLTKLNVYGSIKRLGDSEHERERDKIASFAVEIYETVLHSDAVAGTVSRFILYFISKRNFFRISTFVECNWPAPLRFYLQQSSQATSNASGRKGENFQNTTTCIGH
jgi:hypothetical protein